MDPAFYKLAHLRFCTSSLVTSGTEQHGGLCPPFIPVGGDSGTPPGAAVTTLGYCPHPSSTWESLLAEERMREVHFSSAVAKEGPVRRGSAVEASIGRVGLGFGLGGPGVLRKASSSSCFSGMKILAALRLRRWLSAGRQVGSCRRLAPPTAAGRRVSAFPLLGRRGSAHHHWLHLELNNMEDCAHLLYLWAGIQSHKEQLPGAHVGDLPSSPYPEMFQGIRKYDFSNRVVNAWNALPDTSFIPKPQKF
ncbi:uncharacterized protein LOC132710480 [Pantherophis guttatus]|uniref:Uncharacterized protein LOC132710480 n=1 Tax=Pantherophis guttatus TaxID=94885 RepID=A0ABM3Z2V1_PANGU|nr:uncharacterized protein LOC132710480 [Pantherophis guttatus]